MGFAAKAECIEVMSHEGPTARPGEAFESPLLAKQIKLNTACDHPDHTDHRRQPALNISFVEMSFDGINYKFE